MMRVVADFYIHTKYSYDSFLKPKDIIKVALKRKISVLAVTDHNTIKGGLKTLKIANKNKFDVIIVPGIEIKTNLGDVIGLFIQEEIKTKNYFEVIDEIKSQGGLTAIPHPYRRKHFLNQRELMKIDLIEVLNGRSTCKENELALALGIKLNKALIAGSDAHFSFEIGKIRTILPYKPNDCEELRKMIMSGYSLSFEGELSPYFVHILSYSVELIKKLIKK